MNYRLFRCKLTNLCWLQHGDTNEVSGKECKCRYRRLHEQVNHPTFVVG
jgi:hypothetical protein